MDSWGWQHSAGESLKFPNDVRLKRYAISFSGTLSGLAGDDIGVEVAHKS
jgi:hypothetical protein